MATDVSIIVPFAGDCPHRRAALAWVIARLAVHHLGCELVVAVDEDDPWRKGTAIAKGLHRSSGDIVVVHDADVWCEGLTASIDAIAAGARWSVPHRTLHRLDAGATAQVLGGALPSETYGRSERPYQGHLGGGIVVLNREVALDVPMDVRFEGWGKEDDSWALALRALEGEPARFEHDLWHLWHPPALRLSRRVGSKTNERLHRRYRMARRKPNVMRALIAEAQNEEATWPAPSHP